MTASATMGCNLAIRAALLCLSIGAAAQADELHTTGGEVLIGRVVEEQTDLVIFESTTFGQLRVPRSEISTLTISSTAPTPSEVPAAPAKASAEQVEEAATAERREALDKDAIGRFLARINPLKGWKTTLNFGLIARRGDEDNDNDLNFGLKSTRKTDAGNEHSLEARYYHAEDVLDAGDNVTTDELVTGAYRYRQPLKAPLFFQAQTAYYRDAIKQLDHRVTQTLGVGLRTERDRWRISFTPAGGLQWRQVDGEEDLNVVAGFYLDAGVDITPTLRFAPTLDYLVAVDDKDDYSTRLVMDLTQKLGAAWQLSMRYEYTYDSVVGKDASEEKQRWTLNIGLEF